MPSRLAVILLNMVISAVLSVVISAAMIWGHARWLATAQAPRLAVLDVAELYRLKEIQVAAALVKREGTEAERAALLNRVNGFGAEVTRLLQTLPDECRCLILARGALIGSDTQLTDLTPDARRRLGL